MMPDIDETSLLLGEIKEGIKRLTLAFESEKKTAADNRARMHQRLDDQAVEMARLDTSIKIAGTVAAQAREEVKDVKAKIDDDLGPAIAEWTRIKNMGLGMAVLIGIGGATIASAVWVAVTYFGDAIAAAIRSALRIP